MKKKLLYLILLHWDCVFTYATRIVIVLVFVCVYAIMLLCVLYTLCCMFCLYDLSVYTCLFIKKRVMKTDLTKYLLYYIIFRLCLLLLLLVPWLFLSLYLICIHFQFLYCLPSSSICQIIFLFIIYIDGLTNLIFI